MSAPGSAALQPSTSDKPLPKLPVKIIIAILRFRLDADLAQTRDNTAVYDTSYADAALAIGSTNATLHEFVVLKTTTWQREAAKKWQGSQMYLTNVTCKHKGKTEFVLDTRLCKDCLREFQEGTKAMALDLKLKEVLDDLKKQGKKTSGSPAKKVVRFEDEALKEGENKGRAITIEVAGKEVVMSDGASSDILATKGQDYGEMPPAAVGGLTGDVEMKDVEMKDVDDEAGVV